MDDGYADTAAPDLYCVPAFHPADTLECTSQLFGTVGPPLDWKLNLMATTSNGDLLFISGAHQVAVFWLLPSGFPFGDPYFLSSSSPDAPCEVNAIACFSSPDTTDEIFVTVDMDGAVAVFDVEFLRRALSSKPEISAETRRVQPSVVIRYQAMCTLAHSLSLGLSSIYCGSLGLTVQAMSRLARKITVHGLWRCGILAAVVCPVGLALKSMCCYRHADCCLAVVLWNIAGGQRVVHGELVVGSNSHLISVLNFRFTTVACDAAEVSSPCQDATGPSAATHSRQVVEPAHGHNVPAVSFSPDGAFVASSCIDGILRVWRTHPYTLHAACTPNTEWGWAVRWFSARSCSQPLLIYASKTALFVTALPASEPTDQAQVQQLQIICSISSAAAGTLTRDLVMDRLAFLDCIPELSLVLVASSAGDRVVLYRLVLPGMTEDTQDLQQLSSPGASADKPQLGRQGTIPSQPTGLVIKGASICRLGDVWRLYLLWHGGFMASYDIAVSHAPFAPVSTLF